MAKVCSTCGSPLEDNSKFCTVCGTPVPIKAIAPERYCVQCGNLLRPGIKFCEVCGREAAVEKPKDTPKIVEPTTMDELIIPEINESTFAGNRELKAEKFDGFEAAVMPDSDHVQPSAPPPVPEFAMDTAMAAEPKKEAPKPTPVTVKAKPAAPTPPPAPQNPYPNGVPVPPERPVSSIEPKKKNILPIILAAAIVLVLIIDAIVFL